MFDANRGSTRQFDPRYRTLDHWRGIASIAVVFFHAFGSVRNVGDQLHPLVRPWKFVSDYGWLGVPIFFVISGYCVTASAYLAEKRRGSVKRFLCDRVLRIYPTYWCACLLAVAVNVLAAPWNRVPLRGNLPTGFVDVSANVLLLQPYFGVNPVLEVSWSLVFELAFYMVIAAGLLLFRNGINAVALGIAACLLAVCQVAGPFVGVLYFTNYWSHFLLGAAVFLCCWLCESQGWRAIWPVLIVAVLAVLPWTTQPAFDYLGTSVAITFSLLLCAIQPFDSNLTSVRAGRFLAWLGKISYSLYLTHCFLGLRIINLGGRWVATQSLGQLPLRLFAVALSVAFAFGFFQMCEQPLEKFRRRLMSSGSSVVPPQRA